VGTKLRESRPDDERSINGGRLQWLCTTAGGRFVHHGRELVSWTLELPGEKLERYRDPRGPGLSGMRRLLGALEGRQDVKTAPDRALLRLAFDLGLRRSELASLDLEHLDLEAGTLAVLGKGQEGCELLTLPSETTAVLRGWLEQRGLEPRPLFLNFDRAQKGRRLTSTSIYRIVRWAIRSGFGPGPME
jgi:integrase/recombinase XerC